MKIDGFLGKGEILSPEQTSAEKIKKNNNSFWEEIKKKIKEVDDYQHQADKVMEQGAIKGAENIHEAMIKLQEAEISLKFLLTMRNKALQAYREIMKVQF